MPTLLARRSGLVLVLVCQVLALTACAKPTYWDQIITATLSPDGLTLTAELIGGKARADGTRCEEVASKEVDESSSQVIISIQMRDNCAPIFPWEQKFHKLKGYSFNVDLHLQDPLAGRAVVDKKSRERVIIKRAFGGS